MKRNRAGLPSLLALTLAAAALARADERPPLAELGRSVKLRILVDKVMQPTRGWRTEEWMVQEAAKAGSNVFSPRRGAENPAEVRQVTDWCRRAGVYHLPWMRGVQDVPKDMALSTGRRMVWANGHEQPLWSPNSDELWDWLAGFIIPYAEIGASDNTLMGVFLDYENYWRGGIGNLYALSYDDVIMAKFARSKGLTLPELALDARQPWLEEQNLHEQFAQFQIAHWRQKCRDLRRAVDAVNPLFMFTIYPAPGTLFMLEACYPEWATPTAPLILADPWTYGRPGRYTAHRQALEGNQGILQRGMAVAKAKGTNHIYIGGIDPVVQGADPEFCGRNAVLLSGLGDGYWVFYEGPVYDKDHPEYFHWFARANRHIEQADFAAAWQSRETDDPNSFPRLRVSGSAPRRREERSYPLVKLRGSNAVLVSAAQSQAVRIGVETFRIGQNVTVLTWTLKDTQWQDLAQGEIPVPSTGTIAFAVPEDGVHVLLLEAGGNACAVKTSNVPLALFAVPHARLIFGADRLYFSPPVDAGEIRFELRGGGGIETVKLTVLDAAGNEAASGQATVEENKARVPVDLQGRPGGVWSLRIGSADQGVLEDVYLGLDRRLPPALSFFPDEVFQVRQP